jgi:hypothetical protein
MQKIVLPFLWDYDGDHLGDGTRRSERGFVSYSFREPDWPAFCECRYDEARDEMDREDCPFHCDIIYEAAKGPATRKKPAQTDDADDGKRSAA